MRKFLSSVLVASVLATNTYCLSDFNLSRQSDKFSEDSRPSHKIHEVVRGIYMTGNTIHYNKRYNELVKFVDESDLNSIVIDFKDDSGILSNGVESEYINSINPPVHRGNDFKEKIADLNERGIYPIARIVVFKDPYLSKQKPEWSIKTKSGALWKDRKGITWVDPHNEHVWKYAVECAKEAAKQGFREIQFDYVRFPTDGNTSTIEYSNEHGKEKKDVIYNFLKYSKEELEDYNVYLSADVFGLTTSTVDDMGIGQQFEMISEVVDYISPMTYPSHYGPGNYGFANPNANPYGVIDKAMKDGYKKAEGTDVVIRPWLQDFKLGRPAYGFNEVRAQIKAVNDNDTDTWLFWNAGNKYTYDAYYNLID